MDFWPGYEPELKHQSADWRHAGSPRGQKIRRKPSSVKLTVIAAYDGRGVNVCLFVPHGRTLTTQYYRSFMLRQVQRGVRDKCPDLADSAIILHDRERPHHAECYGVYSDVGDGKNWSTYRTLPTFGTAVLISFPRQRNQ
ncbi:histone-lysine N-methyltransferase SETMAR [Trichonephila clavipes]|nr:histone-lysine N-methyltransferase SETMAR [Trichonephila clavipes]